MNEMDWINEWADRWLNGQLNEWMWGVGPLRTHKNRSCILLVKLGWMNLPKGEYHTNENPLKNSEKNSIFWSKVNVSNNQKKIPYHASLKKMSLNF